MKIKNWNIEEITGYKPLTTFYTDFSIADNFGVNAIIDTYKRAFKSWKDNYKYITELVMVLNWKIHEHYKLNDRYTELYSGLWSELSEWVEENLKDEELSYYFNITD